MSAVATIPDLYDYVIFRAKKAGPGPYNLEMAYNQINSSWEGHLFRFACPRGRRNMWSEGKFEGKTWIKPEPMTGDAILVRRGTDALGRERVAHTPELTERLRADARLDIDVNAVTVEQMGVLAEWARIFNSEFGERPEPLDASRLKEMGLAADGAPLIVDPTL